MGRDSTGLRRARYIVREDTLCLVANDEDTTESVALRIVNSAKRTKKNSTNSDYSYGS